jgi:hypothetical protein
MVVALVIIVGFGFYFDGESGITAIYGIYINKVQYEKYYSLRYKIQNPQ